MIPIGLSLPVLVLSLGVDGVIASQRFCGKHLSDTLSLVCGSRGFFWQEEKRSGPKTQKRDSPHFTSDGRLKSRGIIEECCENPCSLANLESYCASPNKQSFVTTTAAHRMPASDKTVSPDEGTNTGSDVVVTPNPLLQSRMEDLRARLMGGGTNRGRLVSRRPFFFVRPISSRPVRMAFSNNGARLPAFSKRYSPLNLKM